MIPIKDEIIDVANDVKPPTAALVAAKAVNKIKTISGLNCIRGNQVPYNNARKLEMNRFSNWIWLLDWRVKKKNINGEKRKYIVKMTGNVAVLYLIILNISKNGRIVE